MRMLPGFILPVREIITQIESGIISPTNIGIISEIEKISGKGLYGLFIEESVLDTTEGNEEKVQNKEVQNGTKKTKMVRNFF